MEYGLFSLCLVVYFLSLGVSALPVILEVSPSASAQVDRIDVHGGCENFYYMCSGTGLEGKYAAGYECYNTNDRFYSPSQQRFVLEFDLSVQSKQLSAASLRFFVTDVRKAQNLDLYLVSSSWDPVSCKAGGDICVQPYCGECASVFDLKGNIVSSADVSSGKDNVLDVFPAAKDALSKDGKLYLQIRGAEDTWAREGESSCKITDGWDQRDVVFSGGAQGPYLEMIYS